VKTDLEAKTNVRGLYACGEVACTGVHGANRLASNSLLESLVFSARAASAAKEDLDIKVPAAMLRAKHQRKQMESEQLDHDVFRKSIRRIMWDKVGIVRSAEKLEAAVAYLQNYTDLQPVGRSDFELQNMLDLSAPMLEAALVRRESRGAHYRSDYPESDDDHWQRHITFKRNA